MMATPTTGREPRTGTFSNGMEYVTWGGGARTLLLIPGGPGSPLPGGMVLRMYQGLLRPLVDAGFAIWLVTRRRGMPVGHTISDMADDYADVITREFRGRVDVVLGESLGGMIAQCLAAEHPESSGALVLVAAGCEASPWGRSVDARMAAAAARGDWRSAGEAFAEYVLPGRPLRWLRRLLASLAGRMISSSDVPPRDYLVEQQAEDAFDSRPVLPGIRVPVLLLCGDRDRFFTSDVVEETARLIPRSLLVWYRGKGHVGAGTDKRIGSDVLSFLGPRDGAEAASGADGPRR